MQHPSVVEAYLKAGVRPRWMERIAEIDHSIAFHKRDYARRYRRLREYYGDDTAAFAERWREIAAAARFDDLNELITQHNEWYPMERDLDRKSTRLNCSHMSISYAVFCLKKKN